MAEPVFPGIPVEYGGIYLTKHFVDVQELGISLQGLGKFSNSIVNFYLSGEIRDSRLYRVRMFAGPPKAGSLLYENVAIMATGEFPLYARMLCDRGGHFVPHIARAVIDVALGRHHEAHATVDKLVEIVGAHADFAREVHQGHMRDKAWLQDHISQLAGLNRTPMRELVKPVGTSCRQIKLGDAAVTEPAVIDEPEAEVLASTEMLEVGDMGQYQAIFEGVDTTNGACKVRLGDDDRVVRGKITDPALTAPGNPYTHSLDTKQQKAYAVTSGEINIL